MNRKEMDLKFGEKNEIALLDMLRTHFNDNNLQLTSQFHPFDYESDEMLIELKSRTFDHDKYETTMIPLSKVAKASVDTRQVYFIFKFTDCVKYIRYSDRKFSKFRVGTGGRTDRGKEELNYYYYIPITSLRTLIIEPELIDLLPIR